MEKLKPLIAQACTVLKDAEQYKISLNYEDSEWIFQFPIHDVIKTEVAKAILLDPFIPVTVCLKLQIKYYGVNNEGELQVLRVEAYQHRSGKTNPQIKDIAWDFIEKNWGRVVYWLKYGKGGTLMFSTSTNKTKKNIQKEGKRNNKSSKKKRSKHRTQKKSKFKSWKIQSKIFIRKRQKIPKNNQTRPQKKSHQKIN
jgi:hypothetical protein